MAKIYPSNLKRHSKLWYHSLMTQEASFTIYYYYNTGHWCRVVARFEPSNLESEVKCSTNWATGAGLHKCTLLKKFNFMSFAEMRIKGILI
jgi:hypothetical protein